MPGTSIWHTCCSRITPLQLVCISEALRLLFWLLTRYAGMSGLAFWTNIMFVLLACARGWAALTLYKTQEETL